MTQSQLTPATAGPADPPVRPGPAVTSSSGMARDLRTVFVLWRREMLRLRRAPIRIAMGLLTPLMFLLILGTGLSSAGGFADFRTFLFPGVLLMSVQAPAMAVGVSIVWDRHAGFLRQVLVAPARRWALLGGVCLGGATTGTVYGLCVVAVAGAAGIPYRPGLLLVVLELALVAFAFTAAAVLAAIAIKNIESFQVVLGLAMMPLLFLSGAVFPANGLPGWLGTAVLVNPLTYAVDAVRRTMPVDAAATGAEAAGPQWWGTAPPVALELGLIAVLAAVLLGLAVRRFSRAD